MILHVDMDAFYASVEQRDDPSLRGKPVVVGGSASGRGVVSAASYAARRHGVHSAMPMRTAVARCPDLVIVKTRMEHYANISRQIREIFHRFTPLVEPLSLDEAFLDVHGSEGLFGTSLEIGRQIQTAIQKELRLNASVGAAPNKFLAKVASGHDKPFGFVVVEPDKVHQFLDPLPVDRIWGVGARAEQRLAQLGIHRVIQLRETSVERLRKVFGESSANHLHALAWGRDNRPVVPDREAKSISHETTFREDIRDPEILLACMLRLTEQVTRRLRRHERYSSTITIKVRMSDFQTVARSCTLPSPSDSTNEIWQAVRDDLFPRVKLSQPVRLVGVGLSTLAATRNRQLDLFDETSQRDDRVDKATDTILDRFGKGAIQRGTTVRKDE